RDSLIGASSLGFGSRFGCGGRAARAQLGAQALAGRCVDGQRVVVGRADEHDAVALARALGRLPALAHVAQDAGRIALERVAVAAAPGVDAAHTLARLEHELDDTGQLRLAPVPGDLPGGGGGAVVAAAHAARREVLPVA